MKFIFIKLRPFPRSQLSAEWRMFESKIFVAFFFPATLERNLQNYKMILINLLQMIDTIVLHYHWKTFKSYLTVFFCFSSFRILKNCLLYIQHLELNQPTFFAGQQHRNLACFEKV